MTSLASFLLITGLGLSGIGTFTDDTASIKDWQIRGFLAALSDTHQETALHALQYRHAAFYFEAIRNRPKQFKEHAQKQVRSLSKLLTDERPPVRAAAAQALGALGQYAENHASSLAKLLEDDHRQVRAAAAQALGALGQYAENHAPSLTKLLRDDHRQVRAAAAQALGALGQYAENHAPSLTKLLRDRDRQVRAAAAQALGALGQYAKTQVPSLAKLLEVDDPQVRAAAAQALGALGQYAENHAPSLTKLLRDRDRQVRAAAAQALGALGQYAKTQVPSLAKLLEDDDPQVRAAAAQALGALGQYAENHAPSLAKLLEDDDPQVRAAAALALGALGQYAENHAPSLAKLLEDDHRQVRVAAALALGALGQYAENHAPSLAKLLEDDHRQVRRAAAQALGALGQYAENHAPSLAKLLSESDDVRGRLAATAALAAIARHSQIDLSPLTNLLKNDDWPIRVVAALALGSLEQDAKHHAPSLAELLGDQHPLVRAAAARALIALGPFEVTNVPSILINRYYNTWLTGEIRFLAHLLGGGDTTVERLLVWLGAPEASSPMNKLEDEREDIIQALKVFEDVWPETEPYSLLRKDLAYHIGKIVTKVNWTSDDHSRLVSLATRLEQAGFTSEATAVRHQVDVLDSTNWPAWILFSGMAHLLLWLCLIFLYPKFPLVQAHFFWTPWVRRLTGMLYVELLLTSVPFLRRRLFTPFKELLRADARLSEPDLKNYFDGAEVLLPNGEVCSVSQALTRIHGQIVLEGESGLGKTAFLRHLVNDQQSLIVFLVASDCGAGVLESIQAKLKGCAGDQNYLRKLIYAGALDIVIDGLNEAPPDTRAGIVDFAKRFPRCNLLLATQPMVWNRPPNCTVYVLQPLNDAQIGEFLISRRTTLSNQATMSDELFAARCTTYIRHELNAPKTPAEREAVRRVLSNPMDLTVLAHVIANERSPNLFELQKQYYDLLADDYANRVPGNLSFPLVRFSEYMYQLRLTNEFVFADDGFTDELAIMEDHKMVVRYYKNDIRADPVPRWVFRHDKIMDFFLVQTLLGAKNTRPRQHLYDPRFRGALLQMASLIPLNEAEVLERELINHAADTRDHSVSDDFIKVLRSRSGAGTGRPTLHG